MNNRSPLAPKKFPDLLPIPGVSIATGNCGIKNINRHDLLLVELVPNSIGTGVFTTSKAAAPSVDWCRKFIPMNKARGLVVNSGNANAFTGYDGVNAVNEMAKVAASLIGCKKEQICIAQTGVIGERLPLERIVNALPVLRQEGGADWKTAANAISTTDTYAKGASRIVEIDGKPVSLTGIAKGSGMIAPDLATMLAFIFTDAAINIGDLQRILKVTASNSFNSITVDSDTSTNDMVLAFATGVAGNNTGFNIYGTEMEQFCQAFQEIMLDLAHQIVRDGEGARKFIEINVQGCKNETSAKVIAFSIANSPLVKTAIAGEDPNWGRIVMAVGKSGEPIEQNKMNISIGGHDVARAGAAVHNYDERLVMEHMKTENILIEVDIGIGEGSATVWTCDLTHEYISINADYRS